MRSTEFAIPKEIYPAFPYCYVLATSGRCDNEKLFAVVSANTHMILIESEVPKYLNHMKMIEVFPEQIQLR